MLPKHPTRLRVPRSPARQGRTCSRGRVAIAVCALSPLGGCALWHGNAPPPRYTQADFDRIAREVVAEHQAEQRIERAVRRALDDQ